MGSEPEMDGEPELASAWPCPGGAAIYFDGNSSRRRPVTLALLDRLELRQAGEAPTEWSYADIRRADSPSGTLRLTCLTAGALARLDIRDAALAAELVARCARLDENSPGRHSVAAIVGWSLAAAASIVGVILFGVPVAAERLTPLVPQAFERQLGDVAERQIRTLFGAKTCADASGQAAFTRLVNTIRAAAGMDLSNEAAVLATPVPNAFALPGGKVFLFNGLLARAENPDEIAGVLAHEFGHVRHRDPTRRLLHDGGTSFLIGLLFGDITGSGALIFASRSLVTASYSREAEQNADGFAIELMHRLGRSPKPMGQLLFRITGKEAGSLSIVASHPLTQDRLARMTEADLPPSGPPLLTAAEWQSLKAICGVGE
jgi:Zn-dependent protease with chaperone function